MRRFGLLVAAMAALVMADPAAAARPKIPADDLKAIQAMLNTWVPAVVGRHHPLDAYALATPALRSTTTRAQWGRGDIPVAPYSVGGGRYGIRPISVTPDDVIFNLMLQPRKGSDAGVVVYTTEVQRVGDRWLVASMYTTAQFAGPGEQRSITAEPDLGPHAQGVHQRQVLGSSWYGAHRRDPAAPGRRADRPARRVASQPGAERRRGDARPGRHALALTRRCKRHRAGVLERQPEGDQRPAAGHGADVDVAVGEPHRFRQALAAEAKEHRPLVVLIRRLA